MKQLSILVVGFVMLFHQRTFAQFPNFPAADLVLGSADFTTVGSASASPSGIDGPEGIAIDPVTGKVFVAAIIQNRILRFASASSLKSGANAEAVLGQINFSSTSAATAQARFNGPAGICVDRKGRLWVADRNNHRVVMFEGASTLSNGAPADLVLGQAGFVTNASGTSATAMNAPFGVFVDKDDNLWVAEQGNHRVTKFSSASTLTNGTAASVALGQPDLNTGTLGLSATKMAGPSGIFADANGALWVAEQNNNRVLRFDAAATLATGAPASGVLGQPDFNTNAAVIGAQSISFPNGVAVDSKGTLFVIQTGFIRITSFKNAATKSNGASADGVIGQPDFTTASAGISAKQFGSPFVGIAFDLNGGLWVSDISSDRILRFSPDRTRPSLRVTTRVPRSTTKASLALKGKASDSSGIASVRFRSGGTFRNASGTTNWTAKAKLKKGKNRIELIATDGAGNDSATKRLSVART